MKTYPTLARFFVVLAFGALAACSSDEPARTTSTTVTESAVVGAPVSSTTTQTRSVGY